MWWAVVPAVLSTLLTFLVVEKRRPRQVDDGASRNGSADPVSEGPATGGSRGSAARADRRIARSPLPPAFWRVTVILVGIAVVNFPDALLLLRVSELGFSTTAVVLAYVVYNLVYTLGSYPAGAWSDRLPRPLVYGVGLLAFAAAYAGLGLVGHSGWVFVLLAVYGVFPAFTDGVGKAWISTLVDDEHRGRAQGVFQSLSNGAVLRRGPLGRTDLDARSWRRGGAPPRVRRARAGGRARAGDRTSPSDGSGGRARLGCGVRGSGGTGRHAGFRFLCPRACGFKSRLPHGSARAPDAARAAGRRSWRDPVTCPRLASATGSGPMRTGPWSPVNPESPTGARGARVTQTARYGGRGGGGQQRPVAGRGQARRRGGGLRGLPRPAGATGVHAHGGRPRVRGPGHRRHPGARGARPRARRREARRAAVPVHRSGSTSTRTTPTSSWPSSRNRYSGSSSRRTGTSARRALPRWLIASFSASRHLGRRAGRRRPARRSGRSRSRSSPRGSRMSAPAHLAVDDGLATVGQHQRGRAARTRAPRRSSGDVGELGEHAARGWPGRRRAARPSAPRARPGMPLSASTHSPESSATAGRPVAAHDRAGLEQRVVRERRPGLGDLGYVGERRPARRARRRRPASSRIRRQLLDLVRVARREDDAGHDDRAPRCCSRVSSAQPGDGEVEQRVEHRRGRTARPRRCPAPRRSDRRRCSTTFMSVSAATSSS